MRFAFPPYWLCQLSKGTDTFIPEFLYFSLDILAGAREIYEVIELPPHTD
jgi:hypothetical protein